MVTTVAHAAELEHRLTQGLEEAEGERLLATIEVARQTRGEQALETGAPFFSLKLCYTGDRLTFAARDGKALSL